MTVKTIDANLVELTGTVRYLGRMKDGLTMTLAVAQPDPRPFDEMAIVVRMSGPPAFDLVTSLDRGDRVQVEGRLASMEMVRFYVVASRISPIRPDDEPNDDDVPF